MKFLTFKDLQTLGIVTNWPTLGRMIDGSGFPAGIRLSASKRAWSEDEVKAWLATRAIKPNAKSTVGATA
jgi:predicted DNA-binding transcriptional regulator AlpA